MGRLAHLLQNALTEVGGAAAQSLCKMTFFTIG